MKQRRQRRKYYNWEAEIAKGNTDKFYNSTDFDIAREKEFARDNILLMKFGIDWEVIRITDEYINNNIKRLVPAIRKVRDERQRIRKLNNGILPDNYSTQSF